MPKSDSKGWLKKLDNLIKHNIGNSQFNNIDMSQELLISERQLIRKVKHLTGLSPQKYLRKTRLHEARIFLETGEYRTVKEVAMSIGYQNVSYFIMQFEREFGKKPLKILQEAGWR